MTGYSKEMEILSVDTQNWKKWTETDLFVVGECLN